MQTSSSSYVLYENLFIHSSLSASSTVNNSHVRNVIDWRTNTFWKCEKAGEQTIEVNLGVLKAVDSFAIARHNIFSATTDSKAKLQYFNGTWLTAVELTAFENDISLYKKISEIQASRWRLSVNVKQNSILSIAVIMAGKSLKMPFGMPKNFVPPRHNIQLTTLSNQSQNGAFIGRSVVREGFKTEIKQPRVPTLWLRNEGMKFVQHALKKPFFFQWSDRYFPTDSAYCWTDGNTAIGAFQMLDREWQSFNMKIECI